MMRSMKHYEKRSFFISPLLGHMDRPLLYVAFFLHAIAFHVRLSAAENAVNLALGKRASQDSTNKYSASKATDGDVSGYFKDGSCSQTKTSITIKRHWWSVDLKSAYPIHSVVLWNRKDPAFNNAFKNVEVYVSESRAFKQSTNRDQVRCGRGKSGRVSQIKCRGENARYITVVSESKTLSLCEVQVFKKKIKNLAFGKPTRQRSYFRSNGHPWSSKAVDGNVNGNISKKSCSHTLKHKGYSWWYVDLEKRQKIGIIKLWNRVDCCQNRLANAEIWVADKVKISGDILQFEKGHEMCGKGSNKNISSVNCFGAEGRYVVVRVQKQFLSLCEVGVYPYVHPPKCKCSTKRRLKFKSFRGITTKTRSGCRYLVTRSKNKQCRFRVESEFSASKNKRLVIIKVHGKEIRFHSNLKMTVNKKTRMRLLMNNLRVYQKANALHLKASKCYLHVRMKNGGELLVEVEKNRYGKGLAGLCGTCGGRKEIIRPLNHYIVPDDQNRICGQAQTTTTTTTPSPPTTATTTPQPTTTISNIAPKVCTCSANASLHYQTYDDTNVQTRCGCRYLLTHGGIGTDCEFIIATEHHKGENGSARILVVNVHDSEFRLKTNMLGLIFQVDGMTNGDYDGNKIQMTLQNGSMTFKAPVCGIIMTLNTDTSFSIKVRSDISGDQMDGFCGPCNKKSQEKKERKRMRNPRLDDFLLYDDNGIKCQPEHICTPQEKQRAKILCNSLYDHHSGFRSCLRSYNLEWQLILRKEIKKCVTKLCKRQKITLKQKCQHYEKLELECHQQKEMVDINWRNDFKCPNIQHVSEHRNALLIELEKCKNFIMNKIIPQTQSLNGASSIIEMIDNINAFLKNYQAHVHNVAGNKSIDGSEIIKEMSEITNPLKSEIDAELYAAMGKLSSDAVSYVKTVKAMENAIVDYMHYHSVPTSLYPVIHQLQYKTVSLGKRLYNHLHYINYSNFPLRLAEYKVLLPTFLMYGVEDIAIHYLQGRGDHCSDVVGDYSSQLSKLKERLRMVV